MIGFIRYNHRFLMIDDLSIGKVLILIFKLIIGQPENWVWSYLLELNFWKFQLLQKKIDKKVQGGLIKTQPNELTPSSFAICNIQKKIWNHKNLYDIFCTFNNHLQNMQVWTMKIFYEVIRFHTHFCYIDTSKVRHLCCGIFPAFTPFFSRFSRIKPTYFYLYFFHKGLL